MPEAEQATFKFPLERLSPLRQYWEHRWKKQITEQFFREGKVVRERELLALRKAVADRLEFLRSQKNHAISDIREQFRKNFSRSLDHKSLQYNRDFHSKFVNTKKHSHLQRLRQLSEDAKMRSLLHKRDVPVLYGAVDAPEGHLFMNTFGRDFAKVGLIYRKDVTVKDHPIDLRFIEDMPLPVLQKNQTKFPSARFVF